jgi:hypothetical protein
MERERERERNAGFGCEKRDNNKNLPTLLSVKYLRFV